ncbi:MAG: hypothetical protein RLO01_12770 [Thalassobaculaceae bacterium]
MSRIGPSSRASCKACGAEMHPNAVMCPACWDLLPREDRGLITTKRRVWLASPDPTVRAINLHVFMGVRHAAIAKAMHLRREMDRAAAASARGGVSTAFQAP